MFPELLWIVGFYAAAVALVHWMIRRGSGGDPHHYVLVAGNHQMQIEWYIRALQQFSRRTGTEIGITVVLDQSTDDTGKIMERFARNGDGIAWVRRDGGSSDHRQTTDQRVVWVELARTDDVSRLPL
ncbi:hypothetical protein [Cohnella mopanensis]|uniref:hypothetical protein n=1 Tax=Cohnella mopanensis TaxID=2911966 RepID=UPI001EF7FC67|nr:hypothetical protein [Cohnella mopanensis]